MKKFLFFLLVAFLAWLGRDGEKWTKTRHEYRNVGLSAIPNHDGK